jgi:hypothetical protein
VDGTPFTIPAGQTQVVIQVPIIEDIAYAPEETFTLTAAVSDPTTVSNPSGQATGTGTLRNDDDELAVTISDPSVLEGGNLVFQFRVSNPIEGTSITYAYLVVDGTALRADNDYDYPAGQLFEFVVAHNHQTNQTSPLTAQLIVPTTPDTKFERDETLSVMLSSSNCSGTGCGFPKTVDSSAIGTIQNNDAAPTLFVAGGLVQEGNVPADNRQVAFTLALSEVSGVPVAGTLSTASDTATEGLDFTSLDGAPFLIPAGTRQIIVTVPVSEDVAVERDESFTLVATVSDPSTVSNAGGTAAGSGTIVNDDRASVSINNVSQDETHSGQTQFVFTITLSEQVDHAVTLQADTVDGTATAADGDYQPLAGVVVTFPPAALPGAQTQTLTVLVNGDATIESDEFFEVVLSGLAAGGRDVQFADGGATAGRGTIVNDDGAAPSVTLAVDTATIAEAGGVATFTATLSALSSLPVTIDLGFSGTATLTDDYTRSGIQIVIPAGSQTGTITVTAAQDTLDENDETVIVDILSVTNGTESGTQQATTTILDDDDLPPLTPTVVKDDGDWAYRERGLWSSDGTGYQGDVRTAPAGLGTKTAVWSFRVLPGAYRLYATWTHAANRATNTPFTVFIDGISQGPATPVNQQLAPSDGSFGGRPWESLGVFEVSLGGITVQISDWANGVVVADGILAVLVDASQAAPEPGDGESAANDGAVSLPPLVSLDSDNDTHVAPSDALAVINHINRGVKMQIGPSGLGGAFSIDVNADQHVSPLDALLVINHLNASRSTTGAEAEAADAVFAELASGHKPGAELWDLLLGGETGTRRQKRR